MVLLPAFPKPRLRDFLKEIRELPAFDQLGDAAKLFSKDYRTWATSFFSAKTSIVHNILDKTPEDYLATLDRMNRQLQLDRHEDFEQEFKDIVDVAEANSFTKNSYHAVLLQVLYKRILDSFTNEKKPVAIAEIPTGCGKSWLLVLLAAAVQKAFGVSVLIATPTNFLAKYAEETFGIHFGFTYGMQQDAYVSFDQLIDVLPTIQERTFLFFDEIDSFLFDSPMVTPNNSSLKEPKIVFKPELLNHEKVCGVVGVSGTVDQCFGGKALKQMFGEVFFLRAPTLLNTEVALNFRQGMEPCYFFPNQGLHELLLTQTVQDMSLSQPVIVIAEDAEAAEQIFSMLQPSVTCSIELMTELNQIGDIDFDDPFYQRAKRKLERLKKESRIVVVVAKEASRGVDFQFKPGTPAAHIIINFAVRKTSELIQAIGRSCR